MFEGEGGCITERRQRESSLQVSDWRGAAPRTSAHSRACSTGLRAGQNQGGGLGWRLSPRLVLEVKVRRGKRCQHSWGLVAAEENRGRRCGRYNRGGRRKMGPHEGPAAMLSH